MSDENKALVNLFGEEVWNKGNLAAVDELVAGDFVGYGPGTGVTRGPEALKRVVKRMRSAFPDLRFTVEDTIAEGDWNGVAPTGKLVSFSGIAVRRLASGRIVERWVNVDYTGLIRQLGAT